MKMFVTSPDVENDENPHWKDEKDEWGQFVDWIVLKN
jgi:hypothetical protein